MNLTLLVSVGCVIKVILPSSELKRTIEKLELEKAILQAQGVNDWKLVTEKTIGTTLIENLI